MKIQKNGPLWTKKNIKIDLRERFQGSLFYLPYKFTCPGQKEPRIHPGRAKCKLLFTKRKSC